MYELAGVGEPDRRVSERDFYAFGLDHGCETVGINTVPCRGLLGVKKVKSASMLAGGACAPMGEQW